MSNPTSRRKGRLARFLSVLAGAAMVAAATAIPVATANADPNDLDIPDDNFRAALIDALNTEEVEGRDDRDPTDPISAAEAALLKKLVYAGSAGNRISDLTGLEHFKNLEEIQLNYHLFSDLDAFEGLEKLETLRLSAGDVKLDENTDFSPLESLPALT